MPIVILLLVVIGLTISLTLQRLGAQRLVVTRQINAYAEHHSGRGLQEAIGAWLRQQNGRELDEALEEGTGKAMDIILADESVVSIFMFDAQGGLLSELSGINKTQIDEMRDSLKNLSETVSLEEYSRFTRPFGPSSVSVHTAKEPVLRAIAEAIADGPGSQFVNDILLLREDEKKITRQMLVETATRAGVNSEQRAAILRRFATDIQMWGVLVEVRGGRGMSKGRLLARYGGVTMIRSNSGRRNTGNAAEIGAFSIWKDLGIDSKRIEPEDLFQ